MDKRLVDHLFNHYVSLKNAKARQAIIALGRDLLTLDEQVLLLDKCIDFHIKEAGK